MLASDFPCVSPFIYTLRVMDNRCDALIRHFNRSGIGIHIIPTTSPFLF